MMTQSGRAAASVRAVVLSVSAAAALGACGGGGGGDDDSDRVVVPTAVRTVPASAGSDLRGDNAAAMAGEAARMMLGVTGTSLSTGLAAPDRERALAVGTARAAASSWLGTAVRAVSRERPLAVQTVVEPCDLGGTLTVTADDADNNGVLSAGDSFSAVAANCRLLAEVPVGNGRFSIRVNAIVLDDDDFPVAFDASGTFTDFELAGLGAVTGGYRVWSRMTDDFTETTRLSYSGAAFTRGGTTQTLNVDLYGTFDYRSSAAGVGTVTVNGGIVLGGQTYSVVQGAAFVVPGGGEPTAGDLALRDAAGDTLRLTARPGGLAEVTFTPAGASAPTLSLPAQPWSGLAGLGD